MKAARIDKLIEVIGGALRKPILEPPKGETSEALYQLVGQVKTYDELRALVDKYKDSGGIGFGLAVEAQANHMRFTSLEERVKKLEEKG